MAGRGAASLGLAALVALGGCYWPVPQEEHAWPVIVGTLQQDDGAPAGAWQVAVTAGSDCRRATARTRTDADGRFAFTGATLRRRALLLPPVERFWNGFRLCVGDADATLRTAYRGRVPISARQAATPDTLECAVVRAEPAAASCLGGSSDSTERPGGGWTEGERAGRYRLLVDPGTSQDDGPRVFLVWLQDAPAGARPRIAASAGVPLIERLRYLDGVRIIERDGAPDCAAISSTGTPPWYRIRAPRQRRVYELGPPGALREVTDCR